MRQGEKRTNRARCVCKNKVGARAGGVSPQGRRTKLQKSLIFKCKVAQKLHFLEGLAVGIVCLDVSCFVAVGKIDAKCAKNYTPYIPHYSQNP